MAPCRLRILVFPEVHGTWTARALEHDLAAEGRTTGSAVDTLLKIVRAHITYDRRHNRPPLSAFAAAPQLYWSAFTGATRLQIPIAVDWSESGIQPQIVAAVATQHPAIRRLPPVTQIA